MWIVSHSWMFNVANVTISTLNKTDNILRHPCLTKEERVRNGPGRSLVFFLICG